MPPPQSEAQQYENQRMNLHTPQMSEYSAHSAYATAEDEGDADTIDGRRESGSTLEFDTATVTDHEREHQRNPSRTNSHLYPHPHPHPEGRNRPPSWSESEAESESDYGGGAVAY